MQCACGKQQVSDVLPFGQSDRRKQFGCKPCQYGSNQCPAQKAGTGHDRQCKNDEGCHGLKIPRGQGTELKHHQTAGQAGNGRTHCERADLAGRHADAEGSHCTFAEFDAKPGRAKRPLFHPDHRTADGNGNEHAQQQQLRVTFQPTTALVGESHIGTGKSEACQKDVHSQRKSQCHDGQIDATYPQGWQHQNDRDRCRHQRRRREAEQHSSL